MAMLFCIGAREEHAEHFLAAAKSSWLYVFKVNMSTSGAPFRGTGSELHLHPPKRLDSVMLWQRLSSREGVSSFLFGVMSDGHGTALK